MTQPKRMTPAEAEAAFPEIFEAARFLRDKLGDGVRLVNIKDADGNILCGREEQPDPENWVTIERSAWAEPPKPPGTPQPYRGKPR